LLPLNTDLFWRRIVAAKLSHSLNFVD